MEKFKLELEKDRNLSFEKKNCKLILKISFQIQKVSDESVLEKIESVLGRMDDDRDGSLKVEDVLKVKFWNFSFYIKSISYWLFLKQVIETIGKENVQLDKKQLGEIFDLIDKEEIIETEDKIEKALKKEQESRQKLKESFAESEAKIILADKAEELKGETPKKVSFFSPNICFNANKNTNFHFKTVRGRWNRPEN